MAGACYRRAKVCLRFSTCSMTTTRLTGCIGTAVCVPHAGSVEATAQYFHASLLQRLLRGTGALARNLLLPAESMAFGHLFLQYRSQRQNEPASSTTCNGHLDGAETGRTRGTHTIHDHSSNLGMGIRSRGWRCILTLHRSCMATHSASVRPPTSPKLSNLAECSCTNGQSTGALSRSRYFSPSLLRLVFSASMSACSSGSPRHVG